MATVPESSGSLADERGAPSEHLEGRPTARRSDAWDSLTSAHERTVFVSLLALGLRPDQAHDVAQTTWLRLMEKHPDPSKLSFPGIAIAQARFLALDAARRERRELERMGDAHATRALVDLNAGTETRAIAKQRLDRAIAVLASMPENAQRVFVLLFGEPPHGYAEAAEVLGLSLQRVRQITTEIRAELRPTLLEDES